MSDHTAKAAYDEWYNASPANVRIALDAYLAAADPA